MARDVYVKGDRRRTAYTPAEAVGLRFDGWTPETKADRLAPTTTAGASEPPPQSGKGSGRDAWAAYAAGHGVEITDEMSRDDIEAAVRSAGLAE